MGMDAGAQWQRCKCSAPEEIESFYWMNSYETSGQHEAFKYDFYLAGSFKT